MWACVEEWKAGWENKLTTGLMFSLELRLNETLIWLRQAYLIYSKLKAACGSSCFLSPSFPSSSQPTDSLVLSTLRTPCGLLWQNISTSTAMTFGTKIHVPPGCIVISLLSSWRISKATHFDEVHSWSWKWFDKIIFMKVLLTYFFLGACKPSFPCWWLINQSCNLGFETTFWRSFSWYGYLPPVISPCFTFPCVSVSLCCWPWPSRLPDHLAACS